MSHRTSILSYVVVGSVLIGLAVLSWSALTSIQDAQDDTQRVRASSIAYVDVRTAVLAESMAESGYRRAPSDEARRRLDVGIAGVDGRLAAAYKAVPRSDWPVLAQLKLLNHRYADQVRSTLNAPTAGGEDRVAGPAMDAMYRLLNAVVLSHRDHILAAQATEIALADRLRWVLVAAFGLALATVLGILGRLLRDKRLAGEAAAAAQELARARADLLAEEQRQLAEVRDLERARENFSAMVTHDLMNPLTVIEGYAEIITEAADMAEVNRHAGIIRDRVSQMRRLVGDLGRGASPIELADTVDVDLAVIVGDAVEATIDRASAQGISLTASTSPSSVNGDPDRLRQVVDNLLGNAIKFTPSGGTVHVVALPEESDAVLHVIDSGIGIPPDQIDQVFDSYYRASSATSANIPGSGLGLAITKSIVEGHGGTIHAEAGQAGGTVFVVRLPLAQRDNAAVHPPAELLSNPA